MFVLKGIIRVWLSLVERLNGVQEAVSSILATRTKIKKTDFMSVFFIFALSSVKVLRTLEPERVSRKEKQ